MVLSVLGRWARRRLFPLLATAVMLVLGMTATTLIEPWMLGETAWSVPDDLWGTLQAAERLIHVNLAGLYTPPTGLITFPGAAVILAPAVAVNDALGLSLAPQGPNNAHPLTWVVAGPYTIALSALALFAADALGERLGASRAKRAFLAAAGATVLWSVAVEWGHPEDAVAIGLLLYAILALSDERPGRAGWLTGLAIAVQPLVLLAVPVVLASAVERRRLAGFLARAAAPGAVLLGAAAAANWSATYRAVTSQPNWPAIDHPTPWTALAPHMAAGTVAGGPGRAMAIVLACACAPIAARRLRAESSGARWTAGALRELLWWVAVTLSLRSVFESVMVAFYLWPALAVALVAATREWRSLILTAVLAVAVSGGAQSDWRSPWGWWSLMVAGLALTLFFAGVPRRRIQPVGGAPPRPATPPTAPWGAAR